MSLSISARARSARSSATLSIAEPNCSKPEPQRVNRGEGPAAGDPRTGSYRSVSGTVSVKCGVKYARNVVFRPRLAVESWAALNAALITELEADQPTRRLDDGRPVEEALPEESRRLRAMPAHLPATRRVVARVADKFAYVRVDRVRCSVQIRHAYRSVWWRTSRPNGCACGAPRGPRCSRRCPSPPNGGGRDFISASRPFRVPPRP